MQTPRSRRLSAVLAAAASSLGIAAGLAPPASADDASTLTIVGTSDVFDSNLVQSVLKPGFELSHPGVTLNYVSQGTGQAISTAEGGGASALIVHAASLENQFVAAGYSLEPFGRAIFYGDYVLVGPTSDPAGVLTNAPHDIAGAFERIANEATTNNDVNFVSRGNTSGTTVQEHAIWAQTTGVTLCNVSQANGLGSAPSTSTGDCASPPAYPSWYHATLANQAANLLNADTCNYSGGNCYTLTDRGTFQYLESQSSLHNLHIVTSNNSASAPGGSTELVNTFHAYAVNPAKFSNDPNVHINSTGATEFLDWVTSPAAQAAVGAYLANNPAGAPFLPDAAPQITHTAFPTSVVGGHSFTVSGTVSNVVPGTPPLAGKRVNLVGTPPGGTTTTVAHTTTDSTGHYSLTFTPFFRRTYAVATPAITQLEYPDLSPQFSDLLHSASTPTSAPVDVTGTIMLSGLHAGKGVIGGTAALQPPVRGDNAQLKLYGARVSSPQKPLKFVAELPLAPNASSRKFTFHLAPGKWHVQVRYVNPGYITTASTVVRTVTVS